MKLWEHFLPRPEKPFPWHSTMCLLSMLVWGEARGADFRSKVAVAWVVKNRKEYPTWWGAGWQNVILKPFQFSCFNQNDPNRLKLKEPLNHDSKQVWEESCVAAFLVYTSIVEDPTNGADHYYSNNTTPSWVGNNQPVAEIGPFKFFKLR